MTTGRLETTIAAPLKREQVVAADDARLERCRACVTSAP